MDECMDGMFEKWYDKIDEEDSMEDRRKVLYIIVHKRQKGKENCLLSELSREKNGTHCLTSLTPSLFSQQR